MNQQNSIKLFLNGCEEEVRLLSVPHRGYAYLTRDGRMVARGTTDTEAYENLTREAQMRNTGSATLQQSTS